jgi:hypothetical protein
MHQGIWREIVELHQGDVSAGARTDDQIVLPPRGAGHQVGHGLPGLGWLCAGRKPRFSCWRLVWVISKASAPTLANKSSRRSASAIGSPASADPFPLINAPCPPRRGFYLPFFVL